MTLNDCIVTSPSTGECEINLDIAEKYFNNKSMISEYRGITTDEPTKYTLIRYTHKVNRVLKVEISESDALDLIKRLNLLELRNSFFHRGSTWKTEEGWNRI